MKKLLFSILFSGLLSAFYCSASDSIVVVMSKKSSVERLNSSQVANLFLARTNYFPNGERSIPVEFSQSKFRDEFYQIIAGKSSKQLMAYWTTLVFTGKGRPPKAYRDLQPLIDNLLVQKNFITYLDVQHVTDDMKIVYRFP